LQALSRRYSAAIKLDAKEMIEAINQGLRELAERSTTLHLPAAHSQTLNVIRIWTGGAADSTDAGQTERAASDDPLMQGVDALDALENNDAAGVNAQQVLSAGIRDVTETLTADFALNDVLQMVLETMYRGMGFSRTMIFIRDSRLNTLRARFGFGVDIERILPQCSFPVAFAPDVFHVALEKGADIVIENTQAANIIQRIPQWHREIMNAKSFLLLPVMLKNQAVGLLYADSDKAEGIKISAEQLGLLRTLRSQIVLAFKHSGASSRS
jgi:transcriptional regulator with GAF, ATPase, and Fis domain